MYDRLVRLLRHCSETDCTECAVAGCPGIQKFCRNAADAIEERDRYTLTLQHEMIAEAESHMAQAERLNKALEDTKEFESFWEEEALKALRKLQVAVASKPHWIPVEVKLPDVCEDVLLQFPNNQAAGFCDKDGCWGVYSGDGFYTEVADNEPKPTHWAKKLPEPPKEEM